MILWTRLSLSLVASVASRKADKLDCYEYLSVGIKPLHNRVKVWLLVEITNDSLTLNYTLMLWICQLKNGVFEIIRRGVTPKRKELNGNKKSYR